MTTRTRRRLAAAIVMGAFAAALLVGGVVLSSRATGATGATGHPPCSRASYAFGPSDGYGPSPDQANGNYYTGDEDGASGANGAIGYYGPGGPGDPDPATRCVGPGPTGASSSKGSSDP